MCASSRASLSTSLTRKVALGNDSWTTPSSSMHVESVVVALLLLLAAPPPRPPPPPPRFFLPPLLARPGPAMATGVVDVRGKEGRATREWWGEGGGGATATPAYSLRCLQEAAAPAAEDSAVSGTPPTNAMVGALPMLAHTPSAASRSDEWAQRHHDR
ncbi:hypothetical protein BU14_0118s0001 [Porphyra umbilicalis]|uniref:Uncharacterized protein n=1 Tax=Porphyra umbilicalis TaxID=2786 RepID=A0A1X6PBN3_PORUM|nr:hypothetical protein BU14_0118s0001 [Porphyra umbilicalis]|eukprot:OSX78150.1 hypothetical protein BU14_0118s0001 [Porphyra umbilicalis]